MLKSDFYYDLPQELIAQTPLEPRDSSRLMKIDRKSGEITHDRFYNICDYLEKGDLLVLNDSKVFPARLYGVSRKRVRQCSSCFFTRFHIIAGRLWSNPAKDLKSVRRLTFRAF